MNRVDQVRSCLENGQWQTIDDIAAILDISPALVRVHLDKLKKRMIVQKKILGKKNHGILYQYRIKASINDDDG
jgi:predicted ArsR family transcriptional regulator